MRGESHVIVEPAEFSSAPREFHSFLGLSRARQAENWVLCSFFDHEVKTADNLSLKCVTFETFLFRYVVSVKAGFLCFVEGFIFFDAVKGLLVSKAGQVNNAYFNPKL